MQRDFCIVRLVGILWMLMFPLVTYADAKGYRCEVGVQLGGGYYVGDVNKHIFMTPLEVYGGQFRYKFDQRWALQVKAQRQRLSFEYKSTTYYNPVLHLDATAEFNFFRFGIDAHDRRVKRFTPFVFLGIGASVFARDASHKGHTDYPLLNGQQPLLVQAKEVGAGIYLPVGFGLKWKFHERWQLQAAWQHQVYVIKGDGLEGLAELDDPDNMNGTNILNNDYVSTMTIGVVYEFARKKRICHFCE